MRLPIQNGVIVDIDVEEELSDKINGGDLDDDDENSRDFDNTMRELDLEKLRVFYQKEENVSLMKIFYY